MFRLHRGHFTGSSIGRRKFSTNGAEYQDMNSVAQTGVLNTSEVSTLLLSGNNFDGLARLNEQSQV